MSVSDIQVKDASGNFKSVFPVQVTQGGTGADNIINAQRNLGLTRNEVIQFSGISNFSAAQRAGLLYQNSDKSKDLMYVMSDSLRWYHMDEGDTNWLNQGTWYNSKATYWSPVNGINFASVGNLTLVHVWGYSYTSYNVITTISSTIWMPRFDNIIVEQGGTTLRISDGGKVTISGRSSTGTAYMDVCYINKR